MNQVFKPVSLWVSFNIQTLIVTVIQVMGRSEIAESGLGYTYRELRGQEMLTIYNESQAHSGGQPLGSHARPPWASEAHKGRVSVRPTK